MHGWNTGLACSDGLYFGRRKVETQDCANWEQAQRSCFNRAMQAGDIETGVRAICTEGIPYDRCLIGIVTNLDTAQLIPELHIADTEAHPR